MRGEVEGIIWGRKFSKESLLCLFASTYVCVPASWRSATSLPDLTFNSDTAHLISQPPWASHSLMRHNRDSLPSLYLSFPSSLSLHILSFSSSPLSHTHSSPIIHVVSVCYCVCMWDDEANVLLAANYINALSSLNCLSLPAQPFPNTGALSCLSRGWLLRAQAGLEVWEGETHVTVEDMQTSTQSVNSGLHMSRHTLSGWV